jgi:hypothetical protein
MRLDIHTISRRKKTLLMAWVIDPGGKQLYLLGWTDQFRGNSVADAANNIARTPRRRHAATNCNSVEPFVAMPAATILPMAEAAALQNSIFSS